MPKVLEGVKILDFSRYIAGPYATMLLADMGAEVVRVENRGGNEDRNLGPFAPNGESLPFGLILARNKKDITLSLSSPKGRELLDKLLPHFDVVLENFSPEAKGGLGLTYDRLKAVNPAIILVSISAFGESGPYSRRVGYDPVFQALSGFMSFCGFPGNLPTRATAAYVDFSTALSAAYGTMLALYHRQGTGEGQKVELSLMDTAISLMASAGLAAEYQLLGHLRPQIGNQGFYNFSDSFQARDGLVFLCPVSTPIWKRLARAIGREDLASDQRFKDDMSRFQNRHLLTPIFQEWVAQREVAEIVRIMEDLKVPCGWVNTPREVLRDPHVQARGMLVQVEYPEVGFVPQPGVHVRLSQTPGGVERPAPRVGEHNGEVYGQLLGLSPEEMAQLQREGVI